MQPTYLVLHSKIALKPERITDFSLFKPLSGAFKDAAIGLGFNGELPTCIPYVYTLHNGSVTELNHLEFVRTCSSILPSSNLTLYYQISMCWSYIKGKISKGEFLEYITGLKSRHIETSLCEYALGLTGRLYYSFNDGNEFCHDLIEVKYQNGPSIKSTAVEGALIYSEANLAGLIDANFCYYTIYPLLRVNARGNIKALLKFKEKYPNFIFPKLDNSEPTTEIIIREIQDSNSFKKTFVLNTKFMHDNYAYVKNLDSSTLLRFQEEYGQITPTTYLPQ
ncbi:hypothetical protein TH1_079 [Shewanella phage Thanatos-1]|nr:hypothetical protein TH1_079 [Shewanella phage Thanatos-1]